ncbi:MAG TPA: hypothetical protein VMT24_03495 [Aggregatilineaceae bacterium]|nr:hypothetical protein [Aggregatilineaceae bacterium]
MRSTNNREIEAYLCHVTIEALNTWANFSRAYYLSCILDPRTASGMRVSTTINVNNSDQAIGLAIKRWNPKTSAKPGPGGSWNRRDEPPWHIPKVFMSICQNIGCSNQPDITAAFSAGFRVFDDLPVFRNFYAHRNEHTQRAAVRIATLYGIPATLRPSQILLSRPLGRPQPLAIDWLDDLSFTIEYLCH